MNQDDLQAEHVFNELWEQGPSPTAIFAEEDGRIIRASNGGRLLEAMLQDMIPLDTQNRHVQCAIASWFHSVCVYLSHGGRIVFIDPSPKENQP